MLFLFIFMFRSERSGFTVLIMVITLEIFTAKRAASRLFYVLFC